MAEKKNYPGMFDLIKGYAMITILLAHTHGAVPVELMLGENPSIYVKAFFVLEYIISFAYGMMPLFFMISGYGFSVTSMKKCIKKQTKILLIPYLLTSLGATVVNLISRYVYSGSGKRALIEAGKVALSFLLGISQRTKIMGIQLCFIGSVWFLLTLYLSWIYLNAINLYIRERYRPLVVLILALAGYLWGNQAVIPFCLPQSLIGVGYMYVGQQMKKRGWLFKKLSASAWSVIILFSLITIFFGKVGMAYRTWKLGPIDMVGGGCFAFLLARGTLLLNKYNNTITDKLRKVGRYSLWVMCVHSVESVGLLWRQYASKFSQHPFAAYFVVFFMRLCVVYIMCKIVNLFSQYFKKHRRLLRQRFIAK